MKLGYELRALNTLGAKNAVEYNTALVTDQFYTDPGLVQKYIRENVPVHLKNLEILLQEQQIPIAANTVVLDAGCGTGHCLKMLQDNYAVTHLTGIEHSGAALRIARKTCPSARLYQADLLRTDFAGLRDTDRFPDPDRSRPDDAAPVLFDLILCQQVLEHLTKPGPVLRNLVKMLAPGGRLILTVPDGRLDDFAGHIHFWSRDSLPLFLEKELPGYIIVSGGLSDEVSLYAICSAGPTAGD